MGILRQAIWCGSSQSARAAVPRVLTGFNGFSLGSQRRFQHSKVVDSPEEAIKDVQSNIILLCGGFGLSGVPDTLINALEKKHDVQNITAVSNNAGTDGSGLSKLLVTGQITKMIASYIGGNKTFERMYLTGKVSF
jgi:3-oxoacid CoA-transferase